MHSDNVSFRYSTSASNVIRFKRISNTCPSEHICKYKFYLPAVKSIYLMSDRSERERNQLKHERIKFVSTSRQVM